MKRLAILLLLFVYSFTAMGTTLHLHFCCGHLHSFSLFYSDEPACCSKKMHEESATPAVAKKCCHNEIVSIKFKDNQQTKVLNLLPKISVNDILFFVPVEKQFSFPASPSVFTVNRPPPKDWSNAVYLHIRSFRI